MLNSPLISDLIFKGDVSGIKEIMKRSRELGMQTFDQSLFDLYEGGLITYEDALRNADSINDLRLRSSSTAAKRRTAMSSPASATSTSLPDAPTPRSMRPRAHAARANREPRVCQSERGPGCGGPRHAPAPAAVLR